MGCQVIGEDKKKRKIKTNDIACILSSDSPSEIEKQEVEINKLIKGATVNHGWHLVSLRLKGIIHPKWKLFHHLLTLFFWGGSFFLVCDTKGEVLKNILRSLFHTISIKGDRCLEKGCKGVRKASYNVLQKRGIEKILFWQKQKENFINFGNYIAVF